MELHKLKRLFAYVSHKLYSTVSDLLSGTQTEKSRWRVRKVLACSPVAISLFFWDLQHWEQLVFLIAIDKPGPIQLRFVAYRRL